MSSSGANTWNTPLEINNLESQIYTGGGSGVQSVSAGTNITITGTAVNPIINSIAGAVSSLSAGAGIAVNQTTGAITVRNTGVLSIIEGSGIKTDASTGNITIENIGVNAVSSGTGISISGSTQTPIITNTGVNAITGGTGITITGTSTNPIIASTGVQTITAGTNTTITGTATNPIINAINPAIPSGASINVNGGNYAFSNPALLANCIIYSSVPIYNSGITIDFPTYAQLVATYGANAVIPFTIGNLNQNTVAPNQTVYLTCNNDTNPASVYFNQSVSGGNWVADNPTPSTSDFVLSRGCLWKGTVILDSVKQSAFYCLSWLSFL